MSSYHDLKGPAQLLMDYAYLFEEEPFKGEVLDLACGDGHNGLFLAEKGMKVILADRSEEALEAARRLVERVTVDITIWPVDFEREGVNPLDQRFFAGILVFRYLHRPLIPCIRKALTEGGILIYETFTVSQPRFGKPYNPEFLLKLGELRAWFEDWEIIHYFEGIKQNPDRAIAQIVCRKLH